MYSVVRKYGSLQISLKACKSLKSANGFAVEYAKKNKVPVYIMFNNEVFITVIFERKEA